VTARFLLWDVDHTLVELARLHYRLYQTALAQVFGCDAVKLPNMAGRTDRDSSTEFLTAHGIDAGKDNLQRFWQGLVDAVDHLDVPLHQQGHTTEGAIAAVSALAAVRGVRQSVLTGNIRELAVRKLTPFGFGDYLDFEVGAYGEDALDRAALVSTARERLAFRRGLHVAPAEVVLIGDTPLDIAAARGGGAHVVAVATGLSSSRELHDAGADAVLDNLADIDTLVSTILSLGS
jgi:phosphoglycolate phosphatase